MQDGDTQAAVTIHVGVVDGGGETEGGRRKWEILRETHLALEVATVEHRVLVKDHESDVPQEYVIILKFNVESGDALFWVGKIFELSLKDDCGRFGTHDGFWV